jgi:hypothetical protein
MGRVAFDIGLVQTAPCGAVCILPHVASLRFPPRALVQAPRPRQQRAFRPVLRRQVTSLARPPPREVGT